MTTDSVDRLLPLNHCANALAGPDMLGSQAPAYVTLKRWAAAGVLAPAQVLQPGARRPAYRLDVLKRIAAERLGFGNLDLMPAKTEAPASPAAAPLASTTTAQMPSASADAAVLWTLAQIAQTLVEIRDQLAGQAQKDQALINGLTNLDATRKMLMLKYDGEAQSLKSKLAELERDNTQLREAASTIDARKLNVLLSQVSDQLAGLRT